MANDVFGASSTPTLRRSSSRWTSDARWRRSVDPYVLHLPSMTGVSLRRLRQFYATTSSASGRRTSRSRGVATIGESQIFTSRPLIHTTSICRALPGVAPPATCAPRVLRPSSPGSRRPSAPRAHYWTSRRSWRRCLIDRRSSGDGSGSPRPCRLARPPSDESCPTECLCPCAGIGRPAPSPSRHGHRGSTARCTRSGPSRYGGQMSSRLLASCYQARPGTKLLILIGLLNRAVDASSCGRTPSCRRRAAFATARAPCTTPGASRRFPLNSFTARGSEPPRDVPLVVPWSSSTE